MLCKHSLRSARTGHTHRDVKLAKMTKYPAAQNAVMGAHLGSKNTRSLADGLESRRSIGEVAPRFSRINFVGARGGSLDPVCTYNIYREALGMGAVPTCRPHRGICRRRGPRLCHFRKLATIMIRLSKFLLCRKGRANLDKSSILHFRSARFAGARFRESTPK